MATGSSNLTLHRVSNGLFMTDARNAEVVFSTKEYVHTPLPGVHGLWGTFAVRANASYDSNDKRSGAKFVRHARLTRSSV
eukprot:2024598-Pleurochrysis_carterae.AAC.1